MLTYKYGKEPLDLRFLLQRMRSGTGFVLLLTILGTLIFGGSYYIKYILLPQDYYYAQSTYYLEYSQPVWEVDESYYLTSAAWNQLLQADSFIKDIHEILDKDITESMLKTYLSAALVKAPDESPPDYRLLVITVTTEAPALSLEIAAVIEAYMVTSGDRLVDLDAIRIVDPARSAGIVLTDVRPVRAFILSAIVTFFFIVVILLLLEIRNDKIWQPADLLRRYGLNTLGTIQSPCLSENADYLFRNCNMVGIVCIDEDIRVEEVIDKLQDKTALVLQQKKITELKISPQTGTAFDKEQMGILLVIRAGSHNRQNLEKNLALIQQHASLQIAGLLWKS